MEEMLWDEAKALEYRRFWHQTPEYCRWESWARHWVNN